MALLSYQQNIVDLMIKSELTLAELYLFLSKRYSAEADFWLSLQGEELEHAQWVEYLKTRVMAGTALFYEDQTRAPRIESFIGHVNNILMKFKTRKMPLRAALSLAADIEASMLEQKVFQHFEGDDLDLVQTLRRLSKDTERHLLKVKDKWHNTRE
jgi:hypothetical protein